MDIAAPTPEPTPESVKHDHTRIAYAALGAAALVGGIWLVWIGAWLLGWDMSNLGIRPRELDGLIGILTAPFVHASFAHLMSNTLPLGILAALTLYAYPRATRYALPFIWIASGLGVWLWARPSIHVGISGIAHGLMFFLFFMGLMRRDRLAIAIALMVFFLYGGMVLTVLPRDPKISFEYHLFGALSGVIAAVFLRRHDPMPVRKRFSWEDEEDTADIDDDELELPRPDDVPVLWDGPGSSIPNEGTVIAFPRRNAEKHRLH
ncbi:MAG: rhomboid family intramembrane serine protease [Rudaea sp.]